jgi:hypothetical protein
MLFKVLKLFGLDVRAEVAAVKNQIEQRVEDIADRAKHAALSAALIIALSTFAGWSLVANQGSGLFLAGGSSYATSPMRNARRSPTSSTRASITS